MAKVGKCPICDREYQFIEEKPSKTKRKWSDREILSHKINHIESGKIKRVVATTMELTKEQREEVLNFIEKYLWEEKMRYINGSYNRWFIIWFRKY